MDLYWDNELKEKKINDNSSDNYECDNKKRKRSDEYKRNKNMKKYQNKNDKSDSSDSSDSEEDKKKKTITNKNSSSSSSTVFSHDNHVYFYTNVTIGTILSLQKEVRNTINRMNQKKLLAEGVGLKVELDYINLHINSPGGGVFSCFSFIDFMTQMKKKHNVKFHSIVEGKAASAGTLMSVVCDKRSITEYGFMLIHQLSSETWGKYHDIKDDVKNMDSLMDKIKLIYKKHTKIPMNEIDEILKHDIYWDAEKCLSYSLVDEIIN